jgi:imidazolonepropionase-like amidohydrolase
MSGVDDAERRRAVEGYQIMSGYVRRFYEAGVRLNLGTDTPDPGKAALSEMLLLNQAGIPMVGVFRIATLNGAEEVGQASAVGTIEPGKRADLILFDQSPIDRPNNLLGGKTVIKSGVVWCEAAASEQGRRCR